MLHLIFCCACEKDVDARLTDGREIYPYRRDLHDLPFWKCDACKNYVGCHHKTEDRTRPLGVIPTPQIRAARIRVHAIVDSLWKGGPFTRKAAYQEISNQLGRRYHSAEIRTVDEARVVYRIAQNLKLRWKNGEGSNCEITRRSPRHGTAGDHRSGIEGARVPENQE